MFTRALVLLLGLWVGTAAAQSAASSFNPTQAQPLETAVAGRTYTVQLGDTLYRIAKANGTTVEALMTRNRLDSTTVEVGDVLALPDLPGLSLGAAPALPAQPTLPVVAPVLNAALPAPKVAQTGPVRGPSTWKYTPPPVTHRGVGQAAVVRTASTGGGETPPVAFLGGLAYAHQTYNNCGPASISSVLGYYGYRVGQEELRRALRPNGGYMRTDVIAPAVRKYGLHADLRRNGKLADVKRLVGQGVPVIVLQWLDRVGGIPHFRVVRGYDDNAGLVWLSDPMVDEAAYLTYRDFDVLWNTQGRIYVPIYPEGYSGI